MRTAVMCPAFYGRPPLHETVVTESRRAVVARFEAWPSRPDRGRRRWGIRCLDQRAPGTVAADRFVATGTETDCSVERVVAAFRFLISDSIRFSPSFALA